MDAAVKYFIIDKLFTDVVLQESKNIPDEVEDDEDDFISGEEVSVASDDNVQRKPEQSPTKIHDQKRPPSKQVVGIVNFQCWSTETVKQLNQPHQ